MSGLSLLSGLVFAVFWFFPLSPDLRKYWLLLLGIFLYLPFIFFVSSREKLAYFGQVPLKTRLSLLLASTAEWGTALGSFVSVAYLMGLHVPLYNLVPLYFLAVIIGIFSMIPGGIGSFDLIVITGLTSMGVSNALAVSLLLLFRLTYYVIPFLLRCCLLFQTHGRAYQREILQTFFTSIWWKSPPLSCVFATFFRDFLDFVSLNPRTLGKCLLY